MENHQDKDQQKIIDVEATTPSAVKTPNDSTPQNTVGVDSQKKKKKGLNLGWYAVIIVLLAAGGWGVYYSNTSKSGKQVAQTKASSASSKQESSPDKTVASSEQVKTPVQDAKAESSPDKTVVSSEQAKTPVQDSKAESSSEASGNTQPADHVEQTTVEQTDRTQQSTEQIATTEQQATVQTAEETPAVSEPQVEDNTGSTSNEAQPVESASSATPSDAESSDVKEEWLAQQVLEQKHTIAVMQRQLLELRDENASGSENTRRLLLNDTARLIDAAEHEITIHGNIPNAIDILTQARQGLQNSTFSIFNGLEEAISADIVTLQASKSQTTDQLFSQVAAISKVVQTAPMKTPDQTSDVNTMLPQGQGGHEVSQPEHNTDSSQSKWYKKLWKGTKSVAGTAYHSVASDLKDLVRVEKLSDPRSGLLSVQQAMAIRQNLTIQLSLAQQALLSRQDGVWQTTLQTVQDGLQTYYLGHAVKEALDAVATLKETPLKAKLPELTQTRAALAETIRQLKNK